jgi:hypothetical protein
MGTSLHASTERLDERRMLARLALLCGLLIAAGLGVPILVAGEAPAPALALGDVSDAHIVEIRDHRGVPVLSGEFRSRVDVLGNVEMDAALSDGNGRTVIGEVEIEIPSPSRDHRRPELEVDVLGLAARETFSVVIDDRVVGQFNTDDRGSIDMELQEGEIPG